MGMRMLPFFKSKKGWQFAGGGNIDEYGDLPIATENSPGCVKPDGTTTTVSSAGALSANTATGSAAGIVKPDGSTITIEDGVISAATATGSAAGIVKPDGETIEINDGVISTPALIQKEELPTASEDELDKRYLYTGATGSGLVNGYVYKCVSDGGNPATYSWVEADVQKSKRLIRTIISDGTKTYREIFNSLILGFSHDANYVIEMGPYVLSVQTYTQNAITFGYYSISYDGNFIVQYFSAGQTINNSHARRATCVMSTGVWTFENLEDTVVSADTTFNLYHFE